MPPDWVNAPIGSVEGVSAGGVTQLDVELAHRIDEIAAGLGAT